MDMMLVIVLILICTVVFWFTQFCDLMRRRDDEFAGRYDKLIWASAILLTNLFGAFAYWLMKPHAMPRSSDALREQYASALDVYSAKPYEPQ